MPAPEPPQQDADSKFDFTEEDADMAAAAAKKAKRAAPPPPPPEAFKPRKKRAAKAGGHHLEEVSGEVTAKAAKDRPVEAGGVEVSNLLSEDPMKRLEAIHAEEEKAPAKKLEEYPLKLQVKMLSEGYEDAKGRYEAAKADYERVEKEVGDRMAEIAEQLSDPAKGYDADRIAELTEMKVRHEGLDTKADAARTAMAQARKDFEAATAAYEVKYAEWEKQEADADRARFEEAKKRLPPPPALRPGTEEEGAEILRQREAEEERASKEFFEKRKASAKPMDKLDDAIWFGEGERMSKEAEAEQEKIAALRKEIKGEPKKEVIIETPQEIAAAVARVQKMIDAKDINPELFDAKAVKDYKYQLEQKTRLDDELEHAGWWTARKLRKELREVQKNLQPYEEMIEQAESWKAEERQKAAYEKMSPERKKAEEKRASLVSRILGWFR
jgi:hypothetical protein